MARNVLVTGSSHGIGAATAIAFAKQGCNVGIVYCKTKEGAEQTAAACREYGGDIQIFKADLSVRAECEKLMADFLEHYKTIDVLINDAGGALKIPKGEFVDMPLDYWDSQIALNLNAAAYLTQGAIRNMKENNIPGRIVNIGSVHGTISWVRRKMLPYCAAKAGIEMFTKAIAVEVAKYGIRVNCVTPGPFPAPQNQGDPVFMEKLAAKTMLGRFGRNYEMAGAVVLLASDASTFMTGSNIVVDGGWTAW